MRTTDSEMQYLSGTDAVLNTEHRTDHEDEMAHSDANRGNRAIVMHIFVALDYKENV